MVQVGLIGIGFMGMIHYLAYQKVRGAKVAAICTRDKKKLAGDWRGIQGNFGPPGTQMKLDDIGRYERWEDLLADPKIDMVDICLPPAMHLEVTLAALRAGKHVICEKPIALEAADAAKMVKAAERAKKQLLIGQVLPFFPEYAYAYQLATSGKYGRLLGGHFKRIVSDPLWLKDFYDPRQVGGPIIDLHIHDAHFIRLLCGMPSAVFSTGRWRGEVVEFVDTQFLYPDSKLAVSARSGVINQQGRSFTHGYEIYFEKATLTYDFSVLNGEPITSMPLTLLTANGKATQPKLKEVDAFAAELTEVANAVRSGQPSQFLAGNLALDALVLCQKETQSVRSGKPVKV